MAKKNSLTVCDFHHLRNVSKGYAGISFETLSAASHQHLDFYEIIIITQGELEHTINGTTTTLPAGTLLLFRPGITHALFTEPFKSTHFVMCIEKTFFEQYVSRIFPTFDMSNYGDFASKLISKEKIRYIEYLGGKLTKNSRPILSMADEILFLCISDFIYYNDTLDCDVYIAEIIQKLNNQLYMNLSVTEICEHYPYSQSMLLRQFKKLTGMTMVEYKAEQKMKFACQLLSMSDMKIIDIASTLQYNSLSYFLHAFKEAFDMTPSEYRKLHRNEQ